ncbi:hypothetical protein [Yoonia litorea]|uniref:Transferrin-binding protein B C-lobe/N-lobe beta barrel domain-containing protein n=1 Tax=Yoonia litorea TaxID=1123755 RepID=A0A1I6LUT4_9RHOB|nr:hypothetical protein [Yoonia litorea]SFS07209.1 hypothetical protein SAMN05444714_0914 [Yoonia litorea]
MLSTRPIKQSLLVISALVLSACGGSGGGGAGGASLADFASDFAALSADPNINSATPQTTVNALRGSTRYNGVINIGVPQSSTSSLDTKNYYGNIAMTVDFVSGADAVSGTADNFVLYNSFVASPDVGSRVSGSLSFSGATTQDNESIGDGIEGTMTGAIEGVDSSGTFSGSITGLTGNGMRLFLDGPDLGGGVAILVD